MAVYLPRMSATLFVPSVGTPAERVSQESDDNVYRLDVRPIQARLMSNGINDADELHLRLVSDEAGIDPRFLRSAIVYFYLADTANSSGVLTPGLGTNCRFVGIAREVTRDFGE